MSYNLFQIYFAYILDFQIVLFVCLWHNNNDLKTTTYENPKNKIRANNQSY